MNRAITILLTHRGMIIIRSMIKHTVSVFPIKIRTSNLTTLIKFRQMEQIDPDIRELKGYGIAMAALLMFFISFPTVLAQESINAAGGNAMGSGGSVSFSIGQLVYQTHTESYGSVAEGVQQPYEISIVTETEDAMGVNLLLGVYPNPTQDYLVLNTDNVDFSILDFQLYNMQGKLLLSERIARTQTIIPMSDLVPAIYFLKVVQGRNEIKTFKVIKN